MRCFRLDIKCPQGGVLVGGWSATPAGLDATFAQDRYGRPLLPATALRGALRESLERLLRGVGERVCAGGDGVDPRDVPVGEVGGTSIDTVPRDFTACRLDTGKPCRACRLFGSQGDGAPPALVLQEGHCDTAFVEPMVRHGVSVARAARSAEAKHLFAWQVPAPQRDLRFKAEGRVASATDAEDELWQLLTAAAAATTHIGRARSRGLGRVDLQLREVTTEPGGESSTQATTTSEHIRFVVKLESPACVGPAMAAPNVRDTRDYIPGSTFRGAVGTSLAEVEPGPEVPAFRALFNESDKNEPAIFDFLYPVDDLATSGSPAPWPLTARRCKYDRTHHVVDTLLDAIAVEQALMEGKSLAPLPQAERAELIERCACDAPLDRPEGMRRLSAAPAMRLSTRVTLDRSTSSARSQFLFTQVMIDEGTYFEGSIRRIPREGSALLRRGLRLPLSVGRGRSRGWGRVEVITVEDNPHAQPLEERAAKIEKALQEHLQSFGLDEAIAGQLVPLTLLSPLLVDSPDDDGRNTLAKALGLDDAQWFYVARRFDSEAGWDQRPSQRKRLPALASTTAGSVFVLNLGPGRHWKDVQDALLRLERDGAGQRRMKGFGRIIAFDPIINQRSFTSD